MTFYQAWCRPHGRPDLPATVTFIVEQVDYRSAWYDAMDICFRGGEVSGPDGESFKLAPRQWTVRKLKTAELTEIDEDEKEEPEDDWPRPPQHLLDPAARDAELARLYGGLRYDSYRVSSSPRIHASARAINPVGRGGGVFEGL